MHVCGQVTRDQVAGLACFPCPNTGIEAWQVHPWGTIDVNPLQSQQSVLPVGGQMEHGIRLLTHDEPVDVSQIADLYQKFRESPMGDWEDVLPDHHSLPGAFGASGSAAP